MKNWFSELGKYVGFYKWKYLLGLIGNILASGILLLLGYDIIIALVVAGVMVAFEILLIPFEFEIEKREHQKNQENNK